MGSIQLWLDLTEDEAFSLLGLCMTSPQQLDVISERALRKLADYCIAKGNQTRDASSAERQISAIDQDTKASGE